ncbi:methylmalonyl-CoA mutase [Dysgonomonas sp. PFB1-18]|uniref:methylmalonyl-CoA mutase small subunit n=1 Tax=unclassified Dysgonomonas TaxID=2630389 RepID=UPI002476D68F|nr:MULTISPECIES: methylmalonyl-CoA mutase small subunit [unclassified Dysgonomonas]MDH6309611.1 methylmalonyl-CoA mutase [Dysgonomonas sp. PF1-14]MDH6339061.1 methylmalonyl-CoA mutase [Dysgonomonas sp. PF1-16]MDH6380653.1 methylmalonyl-CoA mutase [Dysgonomonas sp. PFB1-18]MDH6398149.1 methylmalonyl-CoA mutase [Dysgonomonas sp. PF1-23]
MANQKEKLFSDFPAVSTEEWMAKITADLKGADFEKKLVWRTNEGFNVNPFYRSENLEGLKTTDSLPGEFPYIRGTKKDNEWYTRQDICVKDFKAANAKALDVLHKGVNSLGFNIDGDDVNVENIKTLLKDIHPEAVELNFSTCYRKSLELTKILVEYIKGLGVDVMNCYGSVNYDPFKPLLKKGRDAEGWVEKAAEIVKAAAPLPRFRVLAVNAHALNDGGSYIFQELGYALANGNQILSALVETGLDATLVAKKIKFNFGIGGNYFMEIAKFRAARWLWAEIVEAYKPICPNECPNKTQEGLCRCAAKIYAHAQTSTFNKTIYDAHVNLLRTQTEAMSATIAGVNSLTVRPFDETYKTSDDFSERIARNQQLLLKEECHFDKITDPSSGSYYIENLTKSIAEQAWKLFLETDEKGFYEALKAGTVQTAVKTSADNRFKALATRREVLLGTNQFPNFTEKAESKIVEREACGCGCGKDAPYMPLPTDRLGTAFEEMRLATEKHGAPTVFMLTIGNLGMRLARAQFSSNFFACAGYKVIDNLGFETVEEGVKAAFDKKADIIVLCSSDDEYATYAPEAHKLIQGKAHFVVAGAPASMDELKAQGIEHFVNVKSNVLETLRMFNAKLGIN